MLLLIWLQLSSIVDQFPAIVKKLPSLSGQFNPAMDSAGAYKPNICCIRRCASRLTQEVTGSMTIIAMGVELGEFESGAGASVRI